MKVVQVSKFYPPVMGGIEAVAWELTEGLNRIGVSTDVLCSHQAARTVCETAGTGYRVVRAGSLGRVLATSMAPMMPRLLSRMAASCELIHLHMPDPMAALALWIARPRAKVVVHWHSDVIRQRVALKAYEPLQAWVLRRADAVIATSQAYAEASVPLQPWRRKVEVVPIGISDNRASAKRALVGAIRQLVRGRRIVFALGRMTYYKGFDVLIEAAQALPDDCAVMIGGDGELLEHYRAMVVQRGLAGKVLLIGHIHDDDLASYFEACDVFCMPSTVRAEAYGVAMVEAMVMGKPIVASDIAGSGVPWVNQHGRTGLNVPVRDGRALAGAISQLMQDAPLRERFGSACRERYLSEFSAERMTHRTVDVYRRLLPAT
jgi:glycosyltransferase involved in cell wall biosynthesis